MEVADYLLSGFSKEEYAGLTGMAPEIIDIILTEANR